MWSDAPTLWVEYLNKLSMPHVYKCISVLTHWDWNNMAASLHLKYILLNGNFSFYNKILLKYIPLSLTDKTPHWLRFQPIARLRQALTWRRRIYSSLGLSELKNIVYSNMLLRKSFLYED